MIGRDLEPLTPEVKNQLEKYVKLIYYLAQKVKTTKNIDELVYYGLIGAVTALKSYNPELKMKLSSYVGTRVKFYILMGLTEGDGIPRSSLNKYYKICKFFKHYKNFAEVDKALNFTPGLAERIYNRVQNYLKARSLDDFFPGKDITYHDLLPAPEKEQPESIVEEANLKELIHYAERVLAPKQKEFVDEYFYNGKTLEAIAEDRSISKQAVSLSLINAKNKLRKELVRLGVVKYWNL